MSAHVESAVEVVAEVEEPVAVVKPVVDRDLVSKLVGDAREQGLSLDGEGGLLTQLTKQVLEAALDGELTDHLGYEPHERGSTDGNARNGSRSKTVLTKAGPVEIDVPSAGAYGRGPTTNAIESVNARIRKAVRARGHFPTEQAALKCVYLAIMALDPTGKGRAHWTQRWKSALNAFEIAFDGRLTA